MFSAYTNENGIYVPPMNFTIRTSWLLRVSLSQLTCEISAKQVSLSQHVQLLTSAGIRHRRNMFPSDFAWGAATAAYQIEGKSCKSEMKHIK